MEKLQKMAENIIDKKYGNMVEHVIRQLDRMVQLLEEINRKLDRIVK